MVVIPAIIMLSVALGGTATGESVLGTGQPGNAGTVNNPSVSRHDGSELQQAGMIPRYLFEYFEDFIFPVYNETGKCRVLLCDIVLELNEGMNVSGERQQLRKLLFRTSQSLSHGVEDIRNMKQQLCDRIKNAVNEAIGKDAVKDVQMTRFLLL